MREGVGGKLGSLCLKMFKLTETDFAFSSLNIRPP